MCVAFNPLLTAFSLQPKQPEQLLFEYLMDNGAIEWIMVQPKH